MPGSIFIASSLVDTLSVKNPVEKCPCSTPSDITTASISPSKLFTIFANILEKS
ncbi:MAG: hypothetical protein K1W33_06830 [Clostridia bacterium]|nr:hypothetical protein [Clostridia bacterium]